MASYPSLQILIQAYFYSILKTALFFKKKKLKLKQTYKQTLEGCQIPSNRVYFGLLLRFCGTICLYVCLLSPRYVHISTYLPNK